MEINVGQFSAYAAVFAATVAGSFALIKAYLDRLSADQIATITKENAKLSARLESSKQMAIFRQKWIDCLRDDMSRFTHLHLLSEDKDEEIPSYTEIGTRIEL